MKTIEVDEDLYRYIASQTQDIGESASDILRRLLMGESSKTAAKVKKTVIASDYLATDHTAMVEPHAPLDRVKTMRSILISDEFAEKEKAIDRFMLILSTLYHIDAVHFSDAAKVKGRTRVYFADNEHTLLASGKTTKPRPIPTTPFWVITNNNTNRKRQMVQQLMTQMGFPQDLIDKVSNAI